MAIVDRSTARNAASPEPDSAIPANMLAHVPPTARQQRADAMHRLQVGMFGLAGMLLLVSLANVIMDRAKTVDAASVTDPAASVVTKPEPTAKDPLVDMGVAPELPVTAKEAPTPTATPEGALTGPVQPR
ncbi:Energy transducer TonB [Novosphingobium lubricantis]|jgi:hypothetical protein